MPSAVTVFGWHEPPWSAEARPVSVILRRAFGPSHTSTVVFGSWHRFCSLTPCCRPDEPDSQRSAMHVRSHSRTPPSVVVIGCGIIALALFARLAGQQPVAPGG